MAKVSFTLPEGSERAYALLPSRAMRIGRDPGNDIVLRDPKVSRHHAEIIFEKGFFVLYDLSSSNGSFVNGKRVRVAPLIPGAALRLGNCLGHFVDDPPTEVPVSTAMNDLAELRAASAEADTPFDDELEDPQSPIAPAHAEGSDEDFETKPHEKFGGNPHGTKPNGPMSVAVTGVDLRRIDEPEPEKSDADVPTDRVEPQPDEPPSDEGKFQHSRFFIDTTIPYGETSTIRDEHEKPLFYFRRSFHLIAFVAGLVAGMVVIAGLAAAGFLLAERVPAQAFLALVLTIVFIGVILSLVPRRYIQIYDDEQLTSIALMLWQESRLSFPRLRFSVRLGDGTVIGSLEKNWYSNFGRRRWWFLDKLGTRKGRHAREDSFSRAIFRLKTNYRLYDGGKPVATLARRDTPFERHLLDLTADVSRALDRRMALGFAMLLESVERR
ncbi:MAG TPA: FHA domain-containing protein [Thermoanaerobaculia bacterium]